MSNPPLSGQVFTRTEIIERAKRGEISPTDAEKWAIENGLEPFATCPTAIEREALKTRFWTLPMTVVWIATRNENAVREVDPEFIKHCHDWRAFELSSDEGVDSHPRFGWEVLPRRLANLPLLQLSEAWDEPIIETQVCSLFDATKQLVEQLRGGTIVCDATDTDGSSVRIPNNEWSKLNFVTDRNRADVARHATNANRIYQHLEFDSFVALEIWPSLGSNADEGPLEPEKASLRAALLNRVASMEISPSEAEAEAKKLGIGPLATKPDDALFEPLAEPRWTLAMAAAWIMWRTPRAAREFWNEYRAKCCTFSKTNKLENGTSDVSFSGIAIELQRLFPIDLSTLLEAAAKDSDLGQGNMLVPPEEARLDLWRKLKSGAVQAYGIPYGHHALASIPAHEWDNLTHEFIGLAHMESVAFTPRHGALVVAYEKVRVQTENILREWSASIAAPKVVKTGGDSPEKTSKRTYSTAEVEHGFKAYVESFNVSGTVPTEPERYIYMKDKFSLTRDRTRLLHKKLSPDAWKSVGRRPKPRGKNLAKK